MKINLFRWLRSVQKRIDISYQLIMHKRREKAAINAEIARLIEEYNRIQHKVSTLSRSEREAVEKKVAVLIANGNIKLNR